MPGKFLTELNVKLVGWNKKADRGIWQHTAPLVFQRDNGAIVEIKTGFLSDFCSVPRHPSIIYGIFGDRLHRTGGMHDWSFCSDSVPLFSFEEANEFFREVALAEIAMPEFDGEASETQIAIMKGILDMYGKPYYHKRTTKEPPHEN